MSADVTPPSGPPRGWSALLLVVVTVAVYAPVVDNGYVWDDNDYVYDNPTLTSVGGLARIWLERGAIPQYYPLVHTTFWLEYRLWGLHPLGFHVVNVLLHALGAVLLWRVLAALGIRGAWWAAALFAVHPVQVESVAWITERKNVLSGAFYFAAMLAYLRWAGLDAVAGGDRTDRRYALCLLWFALALLSKTIVASLPAVLWIVLWWKKGRALDRSEMLSLLPLFAMGVTFGLFTAIYEAQIVGARGSAWDLSLLERIWVASHALWFYLGKLIWPVPLSFNYPRWKIDTADLSQAVYPTAAAALGVALWLLRDRIGRGAAAAVVIFAGTLAPALGFLNVYPMRYSFVADHFQYLACAAPIAYATAAVATAAHQMGAARAAATAGVVVLAAFATLTWRQVPAYHDAETLWRETLRANPDSWIAHSSLCAIEEERANFDAAVEHCAQMERLAPDHYETHHMLGILAVSMGRTDEGIEHFRRAIEIEPGFIHASLGLGAALNQQGRFEEAIAPLRHTLELNPQYAPGHTNLGNALVETGDLTGALFHLQAAVQIAPDMPEARQNLAAALVRAGRLKRARPHLARLVELLPESPEARRQLRALDRAIASRATP